MNNIKLSLAVIATIGSLSFIGCGSSNDTAQDSPTDVVVEDGPVVGAIVKDALGQEATQVGKTNVYRFVNKVTYPITATGGFVDLDGDGEFDKSSEMKLTFPMVSDKGNTITPLTTLIADLNETAIEDLKNKYGFESKDDFYKLPSKDKTIKSYTLSVVEKIIDNNNSVDFNLTTLKSITKRSDTNETSFIDSLKTGGKIPNVKENDFELKIVHVNDEHSHITSEPYKLYFNNVKTYATLGGFARVATKIKELQKSSKNILTLNAGDTFQGTLYYSLFRGDADADMLNMINWDAIELGNHEFDDGDEHLANYLSKLDINSSKILASNIEVEDINPLHGKFSHYTIKTFKNGEKVAIIGIDVVGKTKYSSNPSEKDQFKNEIETAQKYINEVRSNGINKIVLLTHVGLENDKKYAEKLDGVDVIIGGDSHSLMGDFSKIGLISNEINYPFETKDKNGSKVCIGHAWQYNYVIGNMDVIFDENGTVKSCDGNNILLLGNSFIQKNNKGEKVEVNSSIKKDILKTIAKAPNIEIVKEDKDILSKLKKYSDKVDEKKSEVIGTSSETLGHNRIPGDGYDKVAVLPLGSDIAPIVAKAFYEESKLADASIQNAGGVREPVEAGDVTMGKAYSLLPFANTLYEIKMTGAEIQQVLIDAVNEAIHGGVDGKVSTGAFPYAYGLRYDVYTNADENATIVNLEIMDRDKKTWSEINMTKTYTIVTNSYIAGGKDGYTTFKTVCDNNSSKCTDTYLDYAMSFVNYVKKLNKSGKALTKLPQNEHPIKSFHQTLTKIGSYKTNVEAGSEISAYDSVTKRVFTTNGAKNKIDIIDISNPSIPAFVKDINLSSYGTGVNSVAVKDGKLAVAVEDGNETVGKKQLKGKVVVFDADGKHIETIEVGYLPDMVTFNEDGTKIVVANEGEPNYDYSIDPIGSVGIIDVNSWSYVDVNFSNATLADASDGTPVRLGGTPSNDQAKDLEPEYITVDGNYAYVTLQENNAIAKINLTNGNIVYVKSLGAKSYEKDSNNTIDIEENDEIEMKHFPGLFALYQPDTIHSYKIDRVTYLVTANEGDARTYPNKDINKSLKEGDIFKDEKKISKLLKNDEIDSSIKDAYENDNDLKVMIGMGKNRNDKYEKLYAFGGRSFAIWDSDGNLVWDSGDLISKKIAEIQPKLFNQDKGEMDGRSGNRGGEPEALAIGEINGKTYAFVGLERQNAILVWDITDPHNPIFKDYIITDKDGDKSPEGMEFIPANKSPNGKNMLIVSYEKSGTTVFYEVK